MVLACSIFVFNLDWVYMLMLVSTSFITSIITSLIINKQERHQEPNPTLPYNAPDSHPLIDMKTALKAIPSMVLCIFLFLGYMEQKTKITMLRCNMKFLQSNVEFLQFKDSLQEIRINRLQEHTYRADSMIWEVIERQSDN